MVLVLDPDDCRLSITSGSIQPFPRVPFHVTSPSDIYSIVRSAVHSEDVACLRARSIAASLLSPIDDSVRIHNRMDRPVADDEPGAIGSPAQVLFAAARSLA